MSYFPPPGQPVPYATPGVPQPGRRPTSVTVIAIIAIIWGSLAVLGGLCTLPQYLGMRLAPNPAMDAMNSDSLVLGFNVGAIGIGFILGIILLTGGIGALSLKPFARRLLLGYAIAQIAFYLLSLPVQIAVVYPRMMQAAEAKLGANTPVVTGMRIGFFGGVAFGLITMIWPALILYFMTRPHVKAAFEEPPAPQHPGAYFP